MGLGAWKSWGEEGGGRGLQFPGAPVLSLRACRDAAGPWGTGAWGQNRGRRVPGCNDVPRTQQLQVREDVNEVSHTRVAVDPGPQDTGRALLGALTQPQLCLVAHDQGRELAPVGGLQGVHHFVETAHNPGRHLVQEMLGAGNHRLPGARAPGHDRCRRPRRRAEASPGLGGRGP